jgi:hypothetical protein
MSVYSTQAAFEIYIYYLALKRHFTTDYDFFKYNGKVKASQQAFENRKDKFQFYKLSKRKDAKEFILANMIYEPTLWIGDLLDNEKAEEVFTEWTKRQQTLSYVFKNDLSELNDDFNSNLLVNDGQHPRLLQLYNMRRVNVETLVIIDDLVHNFSYWERKIADPIIFPSINKFVGKVRPFIRYDKSKMKAILLDRFSQSQQAA